MKNDIKKWFEKVKSLRWAGALWMEDELPVEIIQTHISVILLGKNRVLKLKKPVNFGFLDYSTLEKRHVAARSEVELNRRLCPEIYLGTKAIIESKYGIISFAGEGEIFDYGVLMKRLPEEGMLDRMVTDNTITESIISGIAEKLNVFHQTARRGADVDEFGSLETIRYNWEENFEQTEPYIDQTIKRSDFELIRAWVRRWLKENKKLLKERVEQGNICDGHGDLRCESICVTDRRICIFDCIEFNERFRCGDVANEAAFLAMDLDVYGRPDLGYFFFEEYARKTRDENLYQLYKFYRCYRAFVRGKVLSFQLNEPEVSEAEHQKARQKAKEYFRVASGSAKDLEKPIVIAFTGLSGTGKTSVARAVAGELGLRVVSSDAVRARLFADEKKLSAYGKEKYDEESNRLTYREMFEKGFELLGKDGGVILDAAFSRAAEREKLRHKAERRGADFRFIECRLSDKIVRQRLKMRAEKKDGFSDANWNIYKKQKVNFESIEMSDDLHLVINTEKTLTESRRQATDWLRANFS